MGKKSPTPKKIAPLPPVKKTWWGRCRSAVTGRWISMVDALLDRSRSVVERINRKQK